MKKNLLRLSLIASLAMIIASFGNKQESPTNINPNSGSAQGQSDVAVESSEESKDLFDVSEDTGSYLEISQVDDLIGVIPEDVLNAKVDIDFLVYIEGQEGVLNDIGNYCWDTSDPHYSEYRYHPENVSSIEMARWFGAAQAFKKLAPGVRINLKYCSIADYPSRIEKYTETYHHLPELMWGTEHVVEMFQKGYNADLEKIDGVAESEYYNSYNEYFKSRFNIGGAQVGIPISAEPWGVFVNLDILSDSTNPVVLNVLEDGVCSEEYKQFVDDFTMERFVDAVKKTTNESHAGLSKVVEYFTSYAVPSINDKFIAEGQVDISSDAVQNDIKQMLEYENELSQYCVYEYSALNGGKPQGTGKEGFGEAHDWSGTKNFCEDQFCTFFAEAPWSLPTIANYVNAREGQTGIVKQVDFLPYPKLNSNTPAYTGIAVEGLTVGNQCPIEDGVEQCYEKDSKLKEQVAAFFAMFAGLDPRSIEARKNVRMIFNGQEYVGDLGLPLIKRNYKYDWQFDEEVLALFPDPAAAFDDNWQFQLSEYLKLYKLYVTNNEDPDVENFTNIMYGLYKMLDSIYMIESDYVTCLNYWNEPVRIEVDGQIEDIFNGWSTRFTKYRIQSDETGQYSNCLGTEGYVGAVLAELATIEEKINKNSLGAWDYLQECVDTYYYDENGDSLYPDVTNKDWRNNYEGSRFM